jgi:hypothetical protein
LGIYVDSVRGDTHGEDGKTCDAQPTPPL